MADKNRESKVGDYVDRSNKDPSPLGRSIFVGLRAADAVLQFSILQRGWGTSLIQRLGGSVVPFRHPARCPSRILWPGAIPSHHGCSGGRKQRQTNHTYGRNW